MLNKIIQYSIKNKLIVGMLTLALIVWGGYSITQLPIDAVPDITNNQVQIITVAPSQSALDIERLVTFPVEQTMATIPNIREIRSFSRFGLSVVTIVFHDKIDVYWARQQVNERLTIAASEIPAGVGVPEIAPITTGLGEIYQYIIRPEEGYKDKFDAMELRSIQDWIVRRQLLGTPGVADVASFGGYLKQYEIALDPDKLRSYNLGIQDIFIALQKNNQNTGGAYIDKKPNAWFIRSEGLISSTEDIGRIVVANTNDGIPILIRNVADVRFGFANRYGAMTYNNEGEVVGAIVLMLKGENSNAVVNRVKQKMEQIQKTLPEGITIEPFLDRSALVNRAVGTVEKNLIEGALIVIFVLVLFLGNIRAGLVVASVIPLSMLFAIAMMHVFGVSGNLMSLGAIDFGLIVDGAVIIVESTMHYLAIGKLTKLNQQEMDEKVHHSASRMMRSAAFGQIIILIVYLPILALVGIEGKMFKPMAQTVSFAILGAFFLSLTYVPMMSALFLSKDITHRRNFSDRMMDFFYRMYKPLLNGALKHKVIVISGAVILFFVSLVVFQRMGGEFLPTLEEGDFAVETRVLTGSSLSYTIDVSQMAAKILLEKFPDEVKEVVGKIGSSEIPTDPMPIEASDVMVILNDKSNWTKAESSDELAEKMGEALEDIPGVTFGFQQPIQMRFNELMTGVRQDVAVKIFGEDLDVLTGLSQKIAKIIGGVNGARDLYVEEVTGLPQIVVEINRDEVAKYGLNIEDINLAVNTAFAGQIAGLVYEGERRFGLAVRLNSQNRESIENVSNLFISSPNGDQIPLKQLANVQFKMGPNQIQREDAKRRIIVGFNVRGRDVASIVNEVQQKIDNQIEFPPGYYPTYGGQFENLKEAQARLSIAVPVALLLIFILLFFSFGSLKQSLLIFAAIPMAAIGGVFALLIRGMPFSISAGIGFIALFGVAVLNGIVLVAEFNRLRKDKTIDLEEIVKEATKIRLRPVLMTATVASLGFLPMALATSAGAEVQKPLATVVIGGLLTSTLLTLIVLPCLYIYSEKLSFGKLKRTATIATVFLLMFLCPLSMQAQNPNDPIDLSQAIAIALKNNPSIISAGYEVDAKKSLRQTSFDLPKTDISYMRGQYNSYSRDDNSLAISQTIPFLAFGSQRELNSSMLASAELKKATTENELILKVKQAYYQLAYLKSRQNLLLQQDSIFEGFYKSASLRFQTGETNMIEQTTAETQMNEIKNQLRNGDSEIQIARTQLKVLLNQEYLPDIIDTSLEELSFDHIADTAALSSNPSVAYMRQQIEVAQAQKKVEAAKAAPDLLLGLFSQTLIGTENPENGLLASPSDRFTGFQVGISIPLWFAPQRGRIKAANYNIQASESSYQHYQTTFKGELQQAAQQYVRNKNNLNYYQNSALPNAVRILAQSQIAFQEGEIDYVEFLLGVKNANAIKEGFLQTLSDYNQSIIYLEFLSGNK